MNTTTHLNTLARNAVRHNVRNNERTREREPHHRARKMAKEVTLLLMQISQCETLREAQNLAIGRIEPTLDGLLGITRT